MGLRPKDGSVHAVPSGMDPCRPSGSIHSLWCRSAGVWRPAGQPNSFAIEHVQGVGIATRFAPSRCGDEFALSDALKIEFVKQGRS